MKSILLIIVILAGMTTASAQIKGLKMNHSNSDKTIVIKENKRVVVHTKDGNKTKGRLAFVNNETVSINGIEIPIADIIKIKHNPLLLSIVIDGLMLYAAGATLGIGLIITAFTGSSAALLFAVPAAALIYGGIKSPKITKGYKSYKGWSYEVITIPDTP